MAAKRPLPRVICVVGPTASGKTALGIALAKKFHGEVVNADSRQVYKGFGIGTGVPEGTRGVYQGHRAFVSDDVPHYLMEALDPTKTFSVIEWRDLALKAIHGIVARGHVPIVVGGTGLYIRALVDHLDFPHVPPNPTMRAELAKKSLDELQAILLKIDPDAVREMDIKNPRRVIRAIEVATFTGIPFTKQKRQGKPLVDALQIGIQRTRDDLYARTDASIDDMLRRGWLDEIRTALAGGIHETAPAMSSVGYRELLDHLRGNTPLEAAVKRVQHSVHQYAKRQLTWFKRDTRIHWVKDEEEGIALAKDWLKKA